MWILILESDGLKLSHIFVKENGIDWEYKFIVSSLVKHVFHLQIKSINADLTITTLIIKMEQLLI